MKFSYDKTVTFRLNGKWIVGKTATPDDEADCDRRPVNRTIDLPNHNTVIYSDRDQLIKVELPTELLLPGEQLGLSLVDADGFALEVGDRVIDTSCSKQCSGWVRHISAEGVEVDLEGVGLTTIAAQNLTHWELRLHDANDPEEIWEAIEKLKKEGPVAPNQVEWDCYRKQKRLADGSYQTYPLDGSYYWAVKHPTKAVFDSRKGPCKKIHVGRSGTPKHRDWCHRFRRRRQLKELYSQLNKLKQQ